MLLAAVCWRCRFRPVLRGASLPSARYTSVSVSKATTAAEEHVHTFLSLRLTGRYRREDWIC
jgi:hypothetical protein